MRHHGEQAPLHDVEPLEADLDPWRRSDRRTGVADRTGRRTMSRRKQCEMPSATACRLPRDTASPAGRNGGRVGLRPTRGGVYDLISPVSGKHVHQRVADFAPMRTGQLVVRYHSSWRRRAVLIGVAFGALLLLYVMYEWGRFEGGYSKFAEIQRRRELAAQDRIAAGREREAARTARQRGAGPRTSTTRRIPTSRKTSPICRRRC